MAYGGETRRPYSVDFKSLSAAPSNPTNGSLYYDNGTGANIEGLYVYDGSTWQKCDVDTLGALTNVSIGSATETDVLALSGSTWVPSGVSASLSGLTDTTITAPASGSALEYNGSVWLDHPNLKEEESTGLLTGGVLSTGAGAAEYSITDGTGKVTDNTGVETYVSWTGLTNNTPANIATNLITFVGISSSGTLVESTTKWTPQQRRSLIPLGVAVHVNLTAVDVVNNEQQTSYNIGSQLTDLAEAIGFFNVDGNVVSANGANLSVNKSEGDMFKNGSNYHNDADNPNVITLAALSAATFQYRFSNGDNGTTGTSIDPDNLDDGAGGHTAVGNNKWSIQRFYSFTSNNLKVQKGVAEYNSLDSAVNAISTESYITEPSIEANGLLRGWLIVAKGATDLSDSAEALFLEAPQFPGGSSAGGASITDLQAAYDNSTAEPEILTNTANGAVGFRRGSAADTDHVFHVQNNAGTTNFSVDGNGLVLASGTINGRDVATDGTKLDTIETSATADQSDAEIKTAYENNANTNALTDAYVTILGNTSNTNSGDESPASITTSGIVEIATLAEVDAGTDGLRVVTPSGLATIQTDVDANTAKSTNVSTDLGYSTAAATGTVTSSDGTNATLPAATTSLAGLQTGADKTKLDGIETSATADQSDAEIRAAVEAATDSNVFTDADHTKLNAIEALADVTDEANVDAAGGSIITSQSGTPSTTPSKVGLINIDTTGNLVYVSTGTSSSGDWALLNDGSLPALDLGDLGDVSTTGQADGKGLFHNGTSFVMESATLGDQVTGAATNLSDVNTAGATETDVLALSGSTWVPSGVSGGSASLSGLTDTSLTSPASGAYLKYDGSNWINENSGTSVDVSVQEISAGASGVVIDISDTTVDMHDIAISHLAPGTDNVSLQIHLSDDGGSTYKSSSYHYTRSSASTSSEAYGGSSTASVIAPYNVNAGNAAGESNHINIRVTRPTNPDSLDSYTIFDYRGGYVRTSHTPIHEEGIFYWAGGTGGVDTIKLSFSAGTIDTGVVVHRKVSEGIGGGSAGSLSGLTDTSLSAPASGEILEYDGTDWVNATNAGGGGPTYSSDVISSGDVSYIWDVSDTGLLDAELKITDCLPATDGKRLKMSISVDGGSTYKAGATDYSYQRTELAGTTRNDFGDPTTTQPQLMNAGAGNATNEGLTFTFNLTNPESVTARKLVEFNGSWIDLVGGVNKSHGHVSLGLTASGVTHVKLFWDSGNFKLGPALL